METPAIKPYNKDGSEQIICHKEKRNLINFWQWAYSDLIGNTERGILAEYLVALACGIDHKPRISWDAYDLMLDDGTRIEVKTSGYLQTWKQKDYSKPVFRISKTIAWDSIENLFQTERMRQADIYIFALHAHKDQETINPLDTNQWEFYILPKDTIDSEIGDAKQITLKKVIDLNAIKSDFDNLHEEIKRCVRILGV